MDNSLHVKASLQPVDLLKQGKEILGDQYMLFVGITAVGVILSIVIPLILVGPMMCGIFLCYFRHEKGEAVAFEHLFKGFDYFVPSLLATLIMVGVSLVIILPITILGIIGGVIFGDSVITVIWSLLLQLVSLAASILLCAAFFFVFPLIVERKLEPLDAVKASFFAARDNMVGLGILALLINIISTISIFLCFIPFFFVMPVLFGSVVLAFRQVFPGEASAAE